MKAPPPVARRHALVKQGLDRLRRLREICPFRTVRRGVETYVDGFISDVVIFVFGCHVYICVV